MINITEAPYNADNTGVAPVQTAIRNAAMAVQAIGGGTVYFPPGTYKIGQILHIQASDNLSNVTFKGEGALILSDNSSGLFGTNGDGGAFTIEGDNLKFEGLNFEGPSLTMDPDNPDDSIGYPTIYQYGRLLMLNGNHNSIVNCSFKNGNGGAIDLVGNYNLISNCYFDECNNHRDGADYGAIHLSGNCQHNIISNNKIVNHYYSGISGSGDGVSFLKIMNNYIISASAVRSRDHSMGIYLIEGANQNIKIIGNTIENADAECIIIFSTLSSSTKNCLIANNTLLNGAYQGIGIRSENSAITYNVVIQSNVIENTVDTDDYHHQIYLEGTRECIISGNKLIGYENNNFQSQSKVLTGIELQNSPSRNLITGNSAKHHKTGIGLISNKSVLSNNICYNCDIGYYFSYCNESIITSNMASECNTSYSKGTVTIQTLIQSANSFTIS